jgi:hypothetical protein
MGGSVFTQPVEGIDDGIKRYAVRGLSERGVGVFGRSDSNVGMYGESSSGVGMWGSSYTENNNKSKFKIAGGTSGMKVSWQVTGIRKDPWANANRIQVEEDKLAKEQGYYIYPDLYGQPEEKGINSLLFPEEKWQEQLVNKSKRPKRF